ncbi:hypothetical protein C0Q70_04839 [Pomacea canaliculata]|uniref:Nuclear pore complex protein Nup160-like n=1 Tax=Pomacea canaliculata TaxID=400727 RepID=A0A2T7PJL7_POMCA|nr:hypothetical protein C0Q70_04839 [Pomacea canaliculata]
MALATLQSKVFKYQLELGHNQEAYTAMMANPDPTRRKDCLRQLVVVLCERGELQTLVEFPYKDMQEEVEVVLEKRARSVDLATHNYYDLLYAFHIYRNNFRKAASIMCEHGMRLGQEIPGLKGLQRQAQCYLAAMNVLRLVKEDYAWIVKPVLCTKDTELPSDADSPYKHSVDGKDKQRSHDKQKVELLELSQLEKEYLLLDARLRLIRKNPDPSLMSGPTPGAHEMVGILVNAGLYDLALTVCHAFSISLYSVFSSLALRCVNLSRASSHFMVIDNNEATAAWEWLRENDIRSNTACRDGSASDHAWRLLQCYLERFEESDVRYHRCVAEKLLSEGFPLPAWLVNSFKVLSASQLFRVYLDYDLLQAAAQLCMEYLDALLGVLQGQDSPAFGLKGLLQHGPMSVWVPYTCVDQLLRALKQHQEDDSFRQLYRQLDEKIAVYQKKISELSGVS